ncbi:hypothetical protein [Spirosoma sp.]|uniref:hypothetical protein n=1 Tax=Spirosoma sp. TaxID=1899569 RepID=UPI00262984D3|nr:hypothetical protein [Spirosoma sp.]MCX6216581.1 hypothetical protein [Spirosoma sp.]
MKRLIIIALSVGLLACEKTPISTDTTDNPAIKLDKLFTVDGCNVYRFHDSEHDVYLTTCSGNVEYEYKTGGKHKHTHRITSLTGQVNTEN